PDRWVRRSLRRERRRRSAVAPTDHAAAVRSRCPQRSPGRSGSSSCGPQHRPRRLRRCRTPRCDGAGRTRPLPRPAFRPPNANVPVRSQVCSPDHRITGAALPPRWRVWRTTAKRPSQLLIHPLWSWATPTPRRGDSMTMADSTTGSPAGDGSDTPPRRSFGVDVGGSGIKGGIVDLDTGQLIGDRFKLLTPHPATPSAVAKTIAAIVNEFKWTGPLGVTYPGVVTNGTVRTAANVDKKWIGTDARQIIGAELDGQKIAVLNDADAAGLAEERYGAGKDTTGVVVLLT